MKRFNIGKAATPEERDISDKNKLLWERFVKPMQAMAAQANAAIQSAQNLVAGIIIEAEGLKEEDWQFNMDTLKLQRRIRSPAPALPAAPNGDG